MDKKINIGTIGNVDSKKTRMTEILKNIEKYLDKLTEEEREEFFKKMGFIEENQKKKEYHI